VREREGDRGEGEGRRRADEESNHEIFDLSYTRFNPLVMVYGFVCWLSYPEPLRHMFTRSSTSTDRILPLREPI
jgi:hypothetical protein